MKAGEETSGSLDACAAAAVLAWYDGSRRRLPWRSEPGAIPDPYVVWLSEIMLQQTTVTTVKPYFHAFLERWPTLNALAAAPLEAVLQQWAGLGYYSRARNLHACAKIIATEHHGCFPRSEQALRRLPGIGPYTAAAIAAIAFGERAAVVDGNVERVIARLRAIETPLPEAKAQIKSTIAAMAPAERPGDFAQAMMDIGATVCTPRRPASASCPLRPYCAAAARGEAERFPLRKGRPIRPLRSGAVFYIRGGGSVLVRTRPERGLLGGMTEFPGTDWGLELESSLDQRNLLREAPIIADYLRMGRDVSHVFTHFSLRLAIFAAELPGTSPPPDGCRWVDEAALGREALPSVMRKVVAVVRASGW